MQYLNSVSDHYPVYVEVSFGTSGGTAPQSKTYSIMVHNLSAEEVRNHKYSTWLYPILLLCAGGSSRLKLLSFDHNHTGKCKNLDSGLDWTHGLDPGLDRELIWTGFWTDIQFDDDHFQVNHMLYLLVSSPDSTLCEGKGLVTVERFLGSCKLSIFKPIRLQFMVILCFRTQQLYTSTAN